MCMRWRGVALISLGANALLVAGCLVLAFHRGHRSKDGTFVGEGSVAGNTRTNFVVRRERFSWRQIESADYPTFILNLREIGCPEQTIRDIIIADVNALYSFKRATNLLTSEQQWWRSE